MAGFCPQCGRHLNEDLECSRHPRVSRSPVLMKYAKPSTLRRLLGAGLEFALYDATAVVVVLVSLMTLGAADFVAALVMIVFISIRDSNSGLFSLEKRLGRMRVIKKRTGRPISNLDAWKRNCYYLLWPALALLPFLPLDAFAMSMFQIFLLVDLAMILFREDGRRLGDFLAGTQVVIERRVEAG